MNSIVPIVISVLFAATTIAVAQIPGADAALDAAGKHGYEAVVLVLIVVTVFALFTWAVRCWITQAATREERLAQRVTTLEDKITERLLAALDKSTQVMDSNSQNLKEMTSVLQGLTRQIERLGDNVVRLETLFNEHDAAIEPRVKAAFESAAIDHVTRRLVRLAKKKALDEKIDKESSEEADVDEE